MGNTPTKTRKIKKYLLQKKYYKLTDGQLEIALKLLKPEQTVSTFLNQPQDTTADDEYLVNKFLGRDADYLAQYAVFPITAEKIRQMNNDVQLEEMKRFSIRAHYRRHSEEKLERSNSNEHVNF